MTKDEALNILWTLLTKNTNAYEDCLTSQIFSSAGIHIAAISATTADITIAIVWHPVNGDPPDLKLTWQGDAAQKWFPTRIGTSPQGLQVAVPRPIRETTLVVSGEQGSHSYGSDSIVLTPLPTR
jgi:hypothetical protein